MRPYLSKFDLADRYVVDAVDFSNRALGDYSGQCSDLFYNLRCEFRTAVSLALSRTSTLGHILTVPLMRARNNVSRIKACCSVADVSTLRHWPAFVHDEISNAVCSLRAAIILKDSVSGFVQTERPQQALVRIVFFDGFEKPIAA